MILLAQSGVPLGIDPRSGFTWVILAAVGIIALLVFSTRRGNAQARSGFPAPTRPAAPAPASRGATVASAIATAKQSFVDDPRASVERAQAIVVRMLAAHPNADVALVARYCTAVATAADPAASLADLHAALQTFASVAEALGVEPPAG